MFRFDRSLILNEKENEMNFKSLMFHMKNETLTDFTKWEWLANIFNEIVSYDLNGFEKPTIIYNELFKFKEFYNYKGILFRGLSIKEDKDFILNENELYSWSSNLDVAENFALNLSDNSINFIAKTYTESSLNLTEFMIEFIENYMDISLLDEFGAFLGEDEVLYVMKGYEKVKELN